MRARVSGGRRGREAGRGEGDRVGDQRGVAGKGGGGRGRLCGEVMGNWM